MKKIFGKVRQNLFGFILGTIIFGSIGVYAATILANEIKYTNNGQENVQGAIDDLYDKSKNNCPEGKTCISKTDAKGKFPICKRATELHTEICNSNTGYGCEAAGYSQGDTIKYGNETITNGELHSGDAFDCDVNLDGTYDSKTERFYYVSNYYNTTTKQFDTSTAVLIYYNNVSEGIANNTTPYAYDSSAKDNWHGPQTAITQLPTTSQWENVNLKNIERTILNETGGTTTTGGTLPTNFSYEGYATRLLTVQEVNAACNITVGGSLRGELDTCQYLMENTMFSSSSMGTYGYWLETPRSSDSDGVWAVYGNQYRVSKSSASNTVLPGVRPAIEVSISDIEY